MNTSYKFSKLFRKAKIFTLFLFSLSIFFIIFKGLNFGIDFKGGTLIELRVQDKNISISDIRSSIKNLTIGDVILKNLEKKGII